MAFQTVCIAEYLILVPLDCSTMAAIRDKSPDLYKINNIDLVFIIISSHALIIIIILASIPAEAMHATLYYHAATCRNHALSHVLN